MLEKASLNIIMPQNGGKPSLGRAFCGGLGQAKISGKRGKSKMNTNKVRLSICGMEYVINTSEEPDYVKSIAYEIEMMIERMMEQNSSMTLNDAYMLCTLSYADRYKKAEENADHIRSQLTEYLEDAARARV